jgi:hypothetical protein
LKFVTELVNSTAFSVKEVERDKVYELTKTFRYENPEYWREVFRVDVDRLEMKFKCECGKFERDGLLCCHVLRLFTQFDVPNIPNHYIVPRWTSEYREKELERHKQEIVQVHGTDGSKCALRYAMLMNNLSDVCSDISRSQEKSKEFIEEVHKLHARIMSTDKTLNTSDSLPITLKDPPVIRSKKTDKRTTADNPEASSSATGAAGGNNGKEQHAEPEHFINISNFGQSRSLAIEEVQISERVVELPNAKKRRTSNTASATGTLRDPPVKQCASVVKGNRMKPQSEKKSTMKKTEKKKA